MPPRSFLESPSRLVAAAGLATLTLIAPDLSTVSGPYAVSVAYADSEGGDRGGRGGGGRGGDRGDHGDRGGGRTGIGGGLGAGIGAGIGGGLGAGIGGGLGAGIGGGLGGDAGNQSSDGKDGKDGGSGSSGGSSGGSTGESASPGRGRGAPETSQPEAGTSGGRADVQRGETGNAGEGPAGGRIGISGDPETREAIARMASGTGRRERIDGPVSWTAVMPRHSEARKAWAAIDGPEKGRPRAPVQLQPLSESEEVDVIMSGWE